MERIRDISNTLEKQVAMLKLRFWGSLFLHMVSLAIIVYLATRSNLLVIDPIGNVYTSKKADRTDAELLLIDSDSHARSFYSTMWTFNHNNRKPQMTKAAHLGGNIIKELYSVLQQKGYYKEIESNNYLVVSTVDSVDIRSFGYNGQHVYLKVYGHMLLENSEFKEIRDLDMELRMILVDRIREINPNGLSIEGINILSNETLDVREK